MQVHFWSSLGPLMKAFTSSEEIPVSTVVKPESTPEADCALECVNFCRRGEYAARSTVLCELSRDDSEKKLKSAIF